MPDGGDADTEIVELALNWSGLSSGSIDLEIFKAVLKAYAEVTGQTVANGDSALWACVGTWLHWLEHNMRRSMEGNGRPKQERELAGEEVGRTIQLLNYLVSVMDDLKKEMK